MWKSACVGIHQLLNWKMHGETLKFEMRCSLISSDLAVHFVTFIPSHKYDSTQTLLRHSLYLSVKHFLHNRNMEETNKGTVTGMVVSTRWVVEPFYYQLMHIMLKNTEVLKHSKINKNAPTCFGLHRNHLQGAKVSAWLKITHLVNSICVKDVQDVVSAMAAYCDL